MKTVTRHIQNSTDDTADSASHGKIRFWSIVLGFLLCLLCIQGVSAYGGKPHYDLTIDAMTDEGGFTWEQMSYVASMDNIVDIISTAWDYPGTAGVFVVPNVYPNDVYPSLHSDSIEQLFSNRAHFQQPTNYTEMNNEWVRLQEQTYRAVKAAELNNDKTGFLAALGMSLHTVQDFYAHTNWADLTDNGDWAAAGFEGDVTWFDVNESAKQNVVWIQAVHDSETQSDGATDKDHVGHAHYDTSYREAYYASRQWISLVKSWVNPAFLASATAPAGCADGWRQCDEMYDGSDCPIACDLNDIFMRLFWYTGTWNGPDSKFTVEILGADVPLDLVQFILYEFYSERIANGEFPLQDKTEYRREFLKAEYYGFNYLYNQNMPPSTSDAHPAVGQIPEKKWLKIHTTQVVETDCYLPPSFGIEHIFPPGVNDPDFFSRIRNGNHVYTEAAVPGEDILEPKYWETLIPVNMDATSIWLHYEIWDDNNPNRESDEICDIWNSGDQVAYGGPIYPSANPQGLGTDGFEGIDYVQCGLTGGVSCPCGDGNEASVNLEYQYIFRDPTATAADSSKSPTVFGEPVTFTAVVYPYHPESGTPSGIVEFIDEEFFGGRTTSLGKVALTAPHLRTSNLTVGIHTITARYLGDTKFKASSFEVTQVVNKASTTTSVSSSKTPIVYGEPVTFTAVVGAVAPGSGTPTGTVTFKDGATTLGEGTLLGGSTTFTPSTTALSAVTHSITAVYAGDTNFTASTSPVFTQVVNKASTTTTVISSKNPAVYSQLAPTFTATVAAIAPGSGTPAGTVTFKDGTTTLGTGTLLGGSTTFTPSTIALSVGTHSITAVYGGNANFTASTSPVFTQTVNPPPKITAYVPSNGKRGAAAFKFVISGSAFQNGATVSLTKTGVPTIDATGVTVSSTKNSITCMLKIPSNAPTGSRSVLVKNPDDGISTVSGFTVK